MVSVEHGNQLNRQKLDDLKMKPNEIIDNRSKRENRRWEQNKTVSNFCHITKRISVSVLEDSEIGVEGKVIVKIL